MARRQLLSCLLLVGALVLPSCTIHQKLARRGETGYRQTGVASWYGPGFHGKRTANGEIYDMYAMTAAHRHLPFDTVVEVTNLDNGRRIQVRINDRGPFIRGRILDVSRAAAERLGLVRAGVAEVRLRVVSPGRSQTREATDWLVQAGAFRRVDLAREQLRTVRRLDERARLTTEGSWHKVVIGPFESEERARRLVAELRRAGIDALVRTRL